MSYLGYVMNALLNDDLKAQDRRAPRRSRRRRQPSSTAAPQRTIRPTASAEPRRTPEIVRPARAAKLGA
jgi:hypothetical protein